jgi:hypothetical protein
MPKFHIENVVSKFWFILALVSWSYFGLIVIGGTAYRMLSPELPTPIIPNLTMHLGLSWGGILISFVGPYATMDWERRKKDERQSQEDR